MPRFSRAMSPFRILPPAHILDNIIPYHTVSCRSIIYSRILCCVVLYHIESYQHYMLHAISGCYANCPWTQGVYTKPPHSKEWAPQGYCVNSARQLPPPPRTPPTHISGLQDLKYERTNATVFSAATTTCMHEWVSILPARPQARMKDSNVFVPAEQQRNAFVRSYLRSCKQTTNSIIEYRHILLSQTSVCSNTVNQF